ncbi:hypothetical protein E2C01_082883 [Portunus trituberculatus]|uniref:Uncharacterized protein n=1 Tax=Portunus trituberculatus TaxID=210409 RepID=A0A5B7J699_PORTR|nr:hypothetical protein [Portunus trituberculatus]
MCYNVFAHLPDFTGRMHTLAHPVEQHFPLPEQSASLEHWSCSPSGHSEASIIRLGHRPSLAGKAVGETRHWN